MMIGVLGSLAEYERELVKERTASKRTASRANGTKFGRPRKVDDPELWRFVDPLLGVRSAVWAICVVEDEA